MQEYPSRYEEGGAWVTKKRKNAKSFGVGYVESLEEFQQMVEKDLLDAVDRNFKELEMGDMPAFQLDAITHRNVVRDKASRFVGRSALRAKVADHCLNRGEGRGGGEGRGNMMIIHGTPGCGKSGLMAAAAMDVINTIDSKEHFLFLHVVDSCPGSASLELMLRRMQAALRCFRRDEGESNISANEPTDISDLKDQQHKFLNETARKYPKKLFVFVIDAVNQLHEDFQAWTMWWLPNQDAPPNLRFLISTLNEENGTFQYACRVCPSAEKVEVGNMSDEDLVEMISSVLLVFNKRLTSTDDPILGNQMQILLSKNKTPLYLIAACEALRKYGIFELVTQYLKDLPGSVPSLFSFLLDDWSEEHGDLMIKDIASLLAVSPDGLLENEINDILRFKEERSKGQGEFLYDSSFSRLYDSLASFLAGGGGGYLRFFHDQLKYAVKRKYLVSVAIELEFHLLLFDFFYSVIEGQLKPIATEEPPEYYEHALQQIVHHQIHAVPKDAPLKDMDKTLRNIYFIRERILKKHHQRLNQEYSKAIHKSSDRSEIQALKQWKKFVQLYASGMEEFPEFAHSMALSQAPLSAVRKDTAALPAPEPREGFPLYWVNVPKAEDAMAVKYDSENGVDCVASPPSINISISVGKQVIIYDQSSGIPIQKLKVQAHSVTAAHDWSTVYIGGSSGEVSWWDTGTGFLKSLVKVSSLTFIWAEYLVNEELVAFGAGPERAAICWGDHKQSGQVVIMDRSCSRVQIEWTTNLPTYSYCFHFKLRLIFSGHKESIVGWNLQGQQVYTLGESSGVGDCVYRFVDTKQRSINHLGRGRDAKAVRR